MYAVPLLLTAVSLSEGSFQRPLLLLVKLRLAEVLLYLDSVQQAKDLVDSIMSMVTTLSFCFSFLVSLFFFFFFFLLINYLPIDFFRH
jgi:ABC-type multidrug transport system permease subunit